MAIHLDVSETVRHRCHPALFSNGGNLTALMCLAWQTSAETQRHFGSVQELEAIPPLDSTAADLPQSIFSTATQIDFRKTCSMNSADC
ncbi:hypothetical protein IFO70_32505 [Phormidium tenue FACHB-886]|nr:hypothetical protein [Phormidium tenue FACHB-886]